MDFAVICILIFLNGFFALAEMSLVAANKVRLHQWAEEGRPGAARALTLSKNPTNFLSTVQIGITATGILSGAFGEGALAQPLEQWMRGVDVLSSVAHSGSLVIAVGLITVVSLLVGELIPKRIALINPEVFACMLSGLTQRLAYLTRPLVSGLSWCTDATLKVFGVSSSQPSQVTQDEIRVLIEQGAEAGVLENEEHAIVSRVFNLDEQRIRAIMTPRADIAFLDVQASAENVQDALMSQPYSQFPVCAGSLDNLLGVVRIRTLLGMDSGLTLSSLKTDVEEPLYVPDTLNIMALLQEFKRTRHELALVVDEYGELQGLVTLHDVMEAMVGDISSTTKEGDGDVLTLQDGTLILEGSMSIARFRELLGYSTSFPGEEEGAFHTLGGLVMSQLSRIPREGDRLAHDGWQLEVVSMDVRRVVKIRASRI